MAKEKDKQKAKALEDKLVYKNENGFGEFTKKNGGRIRGFCDEYIDFINASKTEREFAANAREQLKAAGFVEFSKALALEAGDRVFYDNRGKSIVVAVIGQRPLCEGARIIAAHIDSPRLDLKPNPLYEDTSLAFFKTHYYGGIKKYQWAAMPLAVHGIVALRDGKTVEIRLGEDAGEPTFCVSDILPHLSYKVQDERKARDVIKGEELNVIVGSEPYDDKDAKDPVKLNVLRLLNEKYGICEQDFISAEIEFVPAFKAGYVGFDESLIGGYGQDDRSCAYAALRAALGTKKPAYTTVCVLADKEEIGSLGNTGLDSDYLRNFLTLLARKAQCEPLEFIMASKCLSADVTAAYDPTFASVSDKQNSTLLNHGPGIAKYTGARGKSGTSEASAEYVAEVVSLLEDNKLPWQTGELGKVDEGGGGTVAMFIASLGIDTVDFGVPLLSMHSPYEVSGTVDMYSMYKAFESFLNQK